MSFSSRDRMIALALSGLGLATVVAGLCLGGNPWEARRMRRDQRRSDRLSLTYNCISNRYEAAGRLPTQEEYQEILANVRQNEGSAAAYPGPDPSYAATGARTFTLCMDFERLNPGYGGPVAPTDAPPDFWRHGAGPTCFGAGLPPWVRHPSPTGVTPGPAVSSTAP